MRIGETWRQLLDAGGARWTDGQTDVESFGDAVAEHRAVRSTVGWLAVARSSLIEADGPERAEWMQGLISNDVSKLSEGKGIYATHLTVKGKMIADVRVFARPESFLLEVPAVARETLFTQLDRYLIREQVELKDLDVDWAIIGVHGPRAQQTLEQALGSPTMPAANLGLTALSFGDHPILVVRVNDTGEIGFNVYAAHDAAAPLWERISKAGIAAGGCPIGHVALNTLRTEAGLPWYGVDMDDTTIPVEAGLEAATIDYKKGCYVGQEVIARIQAQGHVNRRLCQLRLAGESVPHRGDKLRHQARDIGAVTSAVFGPTLGCPVALAYVRREQSAPGTVVQIYGAEGAPVLEATVHPLPLADRELT